MRLLVLTILFLFTTFFVLHAQSPQAFNYQAVVRNADATVVADSPVSVEVSLIKSSPQGSKVYTEQHFVTTDNLGLLNIPIGNGTAINGDFSAIEWGSDVYFINIAIDLDAGNTFQDLGTFQLLSVPYALYGKDEDADPKNESIEAVDLQGNTLIIQEAGNVSSVDLSSLAGNNNTDNQTLNLDGTSLSISGGNSVDLESLQDGVEDDDSDPTNEIQELAFDSNTNQLSLSGSNAIALPSLQGFWQQSSVGNIFYAGSTASINNASGQQMVRLGDLRGRGFLDLYSDQTDAYIPFSAFSDVNGGGGLLLSDLGGTKLQLGIDSDGAGSFSLSNNTALKMLFGAPDAGVGLLYGLNETPNIYLGASSSNYSAGSSSNGGFGVYNATNNNISLPQASFVIDDDGRGTMILRNETSDNIDVASIFYDDGFFGFGWTLSANIKFFVMEHPKNEEKQIVYASLEGPEAGAYERGTAQLVNGEAFVAFSEHFELVINPETMTVNLTPNSAESKGLAVVEKTAKGIRVKELFGGTSSYTFDWEAKAVRKGFESFQAIRPAKVHPTLDAPANIENDKQ